MDARASVESLIDWWALAGVTHSVEETPVNWLTLHQAGNRASITGRTSASAQPAVAVPASAMPDTLDAFHDWLATDRGHPELIWPQLGPDARRILPAGPAAPGLMVIADLPDAEDLSTGMLFSGEAGRLFDAMLFAIGLQRDSIYLASLAIARPAGGLMTQADTEALAERMRHHIALVAPRRVLLLGDKTNRALLPTGDETNVLGLRALNLEGGTMPALGIAHPRFLLKHPSAKALCWRNMQYLIEAPLS